MHLVFASLQYLSVELVKLLIDKYPEALMVQDAYGSTPLHQLVSKYLGSNINYDIYQKKQQELQIKQKNGHEQIEEERSSTQSHLDLVKMYEDIV